MSAPATQDEVTIAFGLDANYVPHLAVVITSLVDNAPDAKFQFLVLNDGVPQTLRDQVESCAPNARFVWHDVEETDIAGLEGRGHISRACFFRLLIPEIAPPGVTKVLYLDTDLVVTGDIRDLWVQSLDGQPIGAVLDPGVDCDEFANRFGLNAEKEAYFNSGVMLIDLDVLGPDGFRPAVNLVLERFEDMPYMDQDALNATMWNRWRRLDPVWNAQRVITMPYEGWSNFAPHAFDPDRRPAIVHFTTQVKPWHEDGSHRFIWLYFKYLKRTPFWSSVVNSAKISNWTHVKRRIRTHLNWRGLKP